MSHHHGHHHGHGHAAHPAHARDRTLVLRILVPSLRTALRDKMAELEDRVLSEAASARRAQVRAAAEQSASLSGAAAAMAAAAAAASSEATGGGSGAGGTSSSSSKSTATSRILDLDGVSCAPLGDGSTLWSFRCDGMTYPARLTNLPCPVEVHKTYDHASYYKCVDVGQILIVYEDMTHLEEAESVPNYTTEGYPSYYYSGLTPPMKRVVERRFAAREHRSVAPSRIEVSDVEKELKTLIERVTKDAGKGKNKAPSLSTMGHGGQGRAIEEVEETVVDFEPWMVDAGGNGVTFDEKDVTATKHPEVWLDPEDVRDERAERKQKKQDDANAAAAAAATAEAEGGTAKAKGKKKDGKGKDGTTTKKKKKKKKDAAAAAAAEEEVAAQQPDAPHVKKGIPSLKSREAAKAAAAEAAAAAAAAQAAAGGGDGAGPPGPVEEVDEVTQAATQIANNDEADLMALDDFFNFDDDDDFKDMDLS